MFKKCFEMDEFKNFLSHFYYHFYYLEIDFSEQNNN